jgi:hypothetical protein
MSLTEAERTVNEGTTFLYTCTLKDETGAAVPLSAVNTLTLTLYNKETGTIINSRNVQNVLNANNVTLHATSGLLSWLAQPADNIIVTTDRIAGEREKHIALFEWTWSTTKKGKHELIILVKNLAMVP